MLCVVSAGLSLHGALREGGSEPGMDPSAGSEPARLWLQARNAGGCDRVPWMGWGWGQLGREATIRSLQLCSAPFWGHKVSPTGATPPSKGRAGEPPGSVDVDIDKSPTWDRP